MLKKAIFAASTALVAVSSTANAQINQLNAAELRGNGASSIVNVLNQELNCFGGTNQPTAFGSGTSTFIADFFYNPAKPSAGNPIFDCATQSLQSLVTGKYVSTGSGGGKSSWRTGTASGIPTNPFGTWANIHFAFSDSPLSSSDLSTYDSTIKSTAGAAIQLPLFVLPVAIAYAPNYGNYRATDNSVQPLHFNVVKPRADGSGGLKLSQSTLCNIMNGTITTWSDPALTADNGGVSLADANDTNFADTPIVLVGRSDNSGTTNIFTRSMTSQCGGDFTAGGTDQLPTARKGTALYNATTGALTAGVETAGKFGLVSGSNGQEAVLLADAGTPGLTAGDRVAHATIAYIGADWVLPTGSLTGSSLLSADLINANDSKAYQPTAKNATTAFSSVTTTAPESDTKGKFTPGVSNGIGTGLRNDPVAWIFPANTVAAGSIADPLKGYPIVGTANLITYTCFANADIRKALQMFLGFHFGKVSKDENGAKTPAKLVGNTGTTSLGILAQSGIAPLPSNWANPIVNTFIKKIGNAADPTKEASLGLYIQDKIPTKSTIVTNANPSCAVAQGGNGTFPGIN